MVSDLLVEKRDRILWLTLNRPLVKNAFSISMVEALLRELEQAEYDKNLSCIVITGAGDAFCAGGDLEEMRAQKGMFSGDSAELRNHYKRWLQKLPKIIEEQSLPVIAMVNGPAVGAGCDLAMMCDLRLGSENALFAESFVHLGLLAGDGGAYVLQRVVGYAKAMEMFLTGRKYLADEAKAIGILNQLVPSNDLKSTTEQWASRLTSLPLEALKMGRKAMIHAYRSDLSSHLDLAASMQGILQRRDEHQNRIKK